MYDWFLVCDMSTIGKSIETESRLVVAWGKEGRWGETADGTEVSFSGEGTREK